MWRLVSISILALLASGAAAGAWAESTGLTVQPGPPRPTTCVPDFKSLADELQAKYSEVPVSIGLERDGSLVSIFASSKTGSWTIVMSQPKGQSCVVAAGKNWQIEPIAFGPEV